MVYMGSKNRIAKYLLPIITKYLTADRWYVEPFCGGCNMIDKVKHNKRIAGDVNEYLIALFQELQKNPCLPEFVNRETYYKVKDNKHKYPMWFVGHVGFNCSRLGKFFDCWIGEQSGRNYQREHNNNMLKQITELKDVKFVCGKYSDIYIPDNSVIYCDPPYADTRKYRDGFNHEDFWQWCRDMTDKGHDVLISEYNAPNDFTCVWKKEINVAIAVYKTYKPTEKLFVHKSISDKYLSNELKLFEL